MLPIGIPTITIMSTVVVLLVILASTAIAVGMLLPYKTCAVYPPVHKIYTPYPPDDNRNPIDRSTNVVHPSIFVGIIASSLHPAKGGEWCSDPKKIQTPTQQKQESHGAKTNAYPNARQKYLLSVDGNLTQSIHHDGNISDDYDTLIPSRYHSHPYWIITRI